VILSAILHANALLRIFLIAAGVSAIGWPSSLFLHGYLFQYFPTEPVTYVLFFYIFPLSFVISTIGSFIVGLLLFFRRKRRKPTK
jgi:membrane protein DedA with SNARE-associated domain